jgi:Trypsin
MILACLAAALAAPPSARGEIGGSPAHRAQVPWISDLRGAKGDTCSGTLVRPRLVLTAAHCILPHSSVYLTFSDSDSYYLSSRIEVDPAYSSSTLAHDLAFVRLRRNAPAAPMAVGIYQLDQPAVSYGWGMPHDGRQSQAAYVPTSAQPAYLVASSQPGEGLGAGDSGGPLVQAGLLVAVNEATAGPGEIQVFSYIDQWAWDHIAAGR